MLFDVLHVGSQLMRCTVNPAVLSTALRVGLRCWGLQAPNMSVFHTVRWEPAACWFKCCCSSSAISTQSSLALGSI